MNAEDFKKWLADIHESGQFLLSPFSSQETKKQGRQLLLYSFLTILFYLGIFQLEKISSSSLTIKPISSTYLMLLASIICVYLLIIYWLALFNDLSFYDFKKLLYLNSESKVPEDPLDDFFKKKTSWVKSIREKEELSELLLKERVRKAQEIKDKISRLIKPEATFKNTSEEWKKMEKYWDEKQKLLDDLGIPADADGLEELQAAQFELIKESIFDDKEYVIYKAIKRKATKFAKISFFTELILPSAIGVIGIHLGIRFMVCHPNFSMPK